MRKKWMYLAPAAIVAMLGLIALGGEIVALLWNWLMPPLFGLREITFWQGLGLLALCRILFGGWHVTNKSGGRMGRRARERMAAMTPEERERFRQRMRSRCGFGEEGGEAAPGGGVNPNS